MDISKLIERNKWVATEAQIETLAAAHLTADTQAQGVRGTYLKVLIVAVQSQIGATVRKGKVDQLGVLDKVHDKLYAAVLRGVTSADIADSETLDGDERRSRALARNARSNFARSSKAALVSYIKHGGDIRSLKAGDTSKVTLRHHVERADPATRLERVVSRARDTLVAIVLREAETDPDAARERIEGVIEALQATLEKIQVPGVADTEVTQRTRAGPFTFKATAARRAA